MAAFHGVYVVNVTPFTADRKVDGPGLEGNIRWLVGQGVHGLIPLGSTGEFASLDQDERHRVLDTVLAAAGARCRSWPASRRKPPSGPSRTPATPPGPAPPACSPLLPWYYTPDQEEIYDHYRRVAEVTDLPLMIYNNPFTSKWTCRPPRWNAWPGCHTSRASRRAPGTSGASPSSAPAPVMASPSSAAGRTWPTSRSSWAAPGWVCVIGNVLPKAAVELFDLVVEKKT